MRRLGILLAVIVSMAGPAKADDGRMNVLIKFAEVIAIAGRCPTLTPNMQTLKMLAIGFGIDITDGTPDHQVLEAMVKGKRLDIASSSDDEVCAIGLLGYGPKGINMENLLLEK